MRPLHHVSPYSASSPAGYLSPPPDGVKTHPNVLGYIELISLMTSFAHLVCGTCRVTPALDTPMSTEEITFRGWLVKEGQKVKSWKKRFFTLRSGALFYYESPDVRCTPKLSDCIDWHRRARDGATLLRPWESRAPPASRSPQGVPPLENDWQSCVEEATWASLLAVALTLSNYHTPTHGYAPTL